MNYNTCIYCKWFKDGYCMNGTFEVHDATESMMDGFMEDGILSGCIEEGFSDFKFNKIAAELSARRMSKKAIKEMEQIFYNLFDEYKTDVMSEIDASVSKGLYEVEYDGAKNLSVAINNPSEFSCSKFW